LLRLRECCPLPGQGLPGGMSFASLRASTSIKYGGAIVVPGDRPIVDSARPSLEGRDQRGALQVLGGSDSAASDPEPRHSAKMCGATGENVAPQGAGFVSRNCDRRTGGFRGTADSPVLQCSRQRGAIIAAASAFLPRHRDDGAGEARQSDSSLLQSKVHAAAGGWRQRQASGARRPPPWRRVLSASSVAGPRWR
jgi:hypothetical protein